MPRYAYYCDKCKNILEIVHSIEGKLEICEECEGPLIRVPSKTFMKFKQTSSNKKHKEVGEAVKNHIEESRKELKEQQIVSVEEYK